MNQTAVIRAMKTTMGVAMQPLMKMVGNASDTRFHAIFFFPVSLKS